MLVNSEIYKPYPKLDKNRFACFMYLVWCKVQMPHSDTICIFLNKVLLREINYKSRLSSEKGKTCCSLGRIVRCLKPFISRLTYCQPTTSNRETC